MKRSAILFLCAVLLVAGGCVDISHGLDSAEAGPITGGAAAGAAGAEGEYYLAVSTRADDELVNGATLFCEKLTELSGGMLRVRVVFSEDPAATLRNGGAQLAILDSREHYGDSALLQTSALPFLYSSYYSFTMKANAEVTLSFLSLELSARNMRPLGAYYQGAVHLLSDFGGTGDGLGQSQQGQQGLQQYGGTVIAVDPNTGSEAAFSVLDAGTVEVADPAERARMLLEGEIDAAEFRLEELARAELNDLTGYSLTLTYHGVTPAWLMIDAALYDTLDAGKRAALTEACAHLTGAVDEAYLAREREWLELLTDRDVEVIDEIIATRNRVRNNNYGRIWEISDPDNAVAIQQFLALLNGLA